MRTGDPLLGAAQRWAALGLLTGVGASVGIALADRGGVVVTGLLQIALALGLVLGLLLIVVTRRGTGRRVARGALGLGGAAAVALVVVRLAALVLGLDVGTGA